MKPVQGCHNTNYTMRLVVTATTVRQVEPVRTFRILILAVLLFLVCLCAGLSYFAYLITSVGSLDPEPVPLTTRIYDCNDQLLTLRYVENRFLIPLEDMAPELLEATLAIEDRRFYRHLGFDFTGLGRALLNNFKQRQVGQGGSTITQQLAKNLFLTHERTMARKIREAAYTVHLERYHSKDEILEFYLNAIYYGHAAYGIEAASQTYFGKKAAELSLAEAALLAGLPRSPYYYSPYLYPEAAYQRRRQVLEAMEATGCITAAERVAALKEPLQLRESKLEEPFSYFIDHVINNELSEYFGGDLRPVYQGGFEIYTTVDPLMQQAAEEIIAGLVELRLDQNGIRQPQGALVALDAHTGEIKALVGGRDFTETELNRVYARRSPGSSFKPFVYAAALEQGLTITATQLCAPLQLVEPGMNSPYSPTDFGGGFHHRELDMREALARSCNIAAIRTHIAIGRENTAEMAARLGITSHLEPYYSLPLGTAEVTLMELTASFAPFANGGYRVEPFALRRLVDPQGNLLYAGQAKRIQVLDAGVAFLITDMLKGVLGEDGTAGAVEKILSRPAAGKSGTSQDSKNAHMIGYTPELVAGLYIGDDYENPLGTTGGELAAPLWGRFMQQALEGHPVTDFPIPANITRVTLCAETGLKRGSACTGPSREEYFVAGTEPEEYCSVETCPHCHPDFWWPWHPWLRFNRP